MVRQRQQFGYQLDILAAARALSEQSIELGPLRSGSVVTGEIGSALDLRGEGIQRTVLIVGRTEITQSGMRVRLQSLAQLGGQARLANTGLARNHNDLTLTALGMLPAAE